MPKRRRILKAEITHISLCPRGKNGFRTLYKEDDLGDSARIELHGLTKAAENFDEEGILYACVWAPNVPDADGDWADEPVIKDMAYGWMRDHRKVDLRHDEKALPPDRAYAAESFIIQKDDPRFDGMTYEGKQVDVTGGWGVAFKLEDPELRKSYREGGWDGVSMFGQARFREEEPRTKAAESGVLDRLFGLLKDAIPSARTRDQEVDMKKEDVEALVRDAIKESVGPAVTGVLTEAGILKKDEAATKDQGSKGPDFDTSDPEAVKKHLAGLQRASLAKGVDWNDPKSVAEYQERLAKHLEETGDDKGKGGGREVVKSGQGDQDPQPAEDQVKKEVDAGLSIANHINRGRGRKVEKKGA